MLISGILLYKFKETFQSEGHYNDYEKRVEFYKTYLILKVLVGQAWVMISFKLASDQLSKHCEKYEKDCDYLKDVYHWSFWINFVFTTLIGAYFAFVCKLYADQALPSIRTHHDSLPITRDSVKSYAPTG